MIRPELQKELREYFDGSVAARMGVRSVMDAQINRLKLGISGGFDPSYCMDESCLEAAWDWKRVDGVLRLLSDADRLVLRLRYEPMTLGEADGLEPFQLNARVAIVIYGLHGKNPGTVLSLKEAAGRGVGESNLASYAVERAALVELCKRARRAKGNAKQQAATQVYTIVGQATLRVQMAEDAYSAAAVEHRDTRRPWYTVDDRRRWMQ